VHDPTGTFWRRALRVAIVVPLLYSVLQFGLGWSNAALPSAFAAFSLLSFADLGGPAKDRLRANLILVSVGVSLMAIGSVFGLWRWPAVIATAVVVFAISYASVLRGYFSAASTAAIVPWVFAATSTPALDQIPGRCIGWAIGGLVATAAAALIFPKHVTSELRVRLAESLASSAAAIRALAQRNSRSDASASDEQAVVAIGELVESVQRLHEAYDGRMIRPGSGTKRDRALTLAIDEIDRLKVVLTSWRFNVLMQMRPIDIEMSMRSADVLDECCAALNGAPNGVDAVALNADRERHLQDIERWVAGELDEPGDSEELTVRLEAAFQVRVTSMTAQLAAIYVEGAVGDPAQRNKRARRASGSKEPRAQLTFSDKRLFDPAVQARPMEQLRAQWSPHSPWLRTALRTSLALSITVLIVSLTGVQHGFWIPLGALVALKFDVSGTKKSAAQILIGTLSGFAIGSLLVLAIGYDVGLFWVLLPVTAFLAAFTPGAVSLVVGQASFTMFIIVLFGITDPASFKTGEIRIQDVLLGVLVSLGVSMLIWPRGITPMVYRRVSEAMNSAGTYFVSAFDSIVEGPAVQRQVQVVETAARREIGRADETLDLALAQVGSGLSDRELWLMAMNCATQLTYAGDVIRSLGKLATWPRTALTSADITLASAHRVQARFLALVDLLGEDDPIAQHAAAVDDEAIPDAQRLEYVARVRAAITTDLALLRANTDTVAHQAMIMVFASSWVEQLGWLSQRFSNRIDETLMAPADDQLARD